jgi:hypothetical protein
VQLIEWRGLGLSFRSSDAAEKRNDIGFVINNCMFESSFTIAATQGVKNTAAQQMRA